VLASWAVEQLFRTSPALCAVLRAWGAYETGTVISCSFPRGRPRPPGPGAARRLPMAARKALIGRTIQSGRTDRRAALLSRCHGSATAPGTHPRVRPKQSVSVIGLACSAASVALDGKCFIAVKA